MDFLYAGDLFQHHLQLLVQLCVLSLLLFETTLVKLQLLLGLHDQLLQVTVLLGQLLVPHQLTNLRLLQLRVVHPRRFFQFSQLGLQDFIFLLIGHGLLHPVFRQSIGSTPSSIDLELRAKPSDDQPKPESFLRNLFEV